MDIEDQIKLHKEISKKIDELEDQKKELGVFIMQKMESKTIQVPGYQVRCCSRLSIKLSIEEARSYNAVKFEEMVDKDKIKDLYNSGQTISGVSENYYIVISEQREKQIMQRKK